MFRYLYPVLFQAEDRIRYLTVTGVQTCALPISLVSSITTTRLSLRSFQCNIPLPTSIAYTFDAPRWSRQLVNPPVDEPTSAQTNPVTSILNASRAASSFS